MVGCDVGGLSPLRGPLATVTADRKYTEIAARVARVLPDALPGVARMKRSGMRESRIALRSIRATLDYGMANVALSIARSTSRAACVSNPSAYLMFVAYPRLAERLLQLFLLAPNEQVHQREMDRGEN
jgi:hypothetical protein